MTGNTETTTTPAAESPMMLDFLNSIMGAEITRQISPALRERQREEARVETVYVPMHREGTFSHELNNLSRQAVAVLGTDVYMASLL